MGSYHTKKLCTPVGDFTKRCVHTYADLIFVSSHSIVCDVFLSTRVKQSWKRWQPRAKATPAATVHGSVRPRILGRPCPGSGSIATVAVSLARQNISRLWVRQYNRDFGEGGYTSAAAANAAVRFTTRPPSLTLIAPRLSVATLVHSSPLSSSTKNNEHLSAPTRLWPSSRIVANKVSISRCKISRTEVNR